MYRHLSMITLAMLTLAACQSSQGSGSYGQYMQQRDGGMASSMGGVINGPAVTSGSFEGSASRPRADVIAGVAHQSGEAVHAPARLSDEQNFDAVASRESIASDAERRRQQQAQYVQYQAGALPERTIDTGPNIVDFALATSHPPGVKMYDRGGFSFRSYESACGAFTSADMAQKEFLAKGGPQRDRLGVDPDGDGYACGWDPRPFRAGL